MISYKGTSRITIFIGNYVFKIPNIRQGHKLFLCGCYCNWTERSLYKNWYCYSKDFKNKICPSLFSSWFGLLQIQKRCVELDRHLTDIEKEYFKNITEDLKKENFGYYNNKLVCFDYA